MEGEAKSREIRGLENQKTSLHTQMRIQQRQAQKLAESVLSALDVPKSLGVSVSLRDEAAARKAYELAQDVLA